MGTPQGIWFHTTHRTTWTNFIAPTGNRIRDSSVQSAFKTIVEDGEHRIRTILRLESLKARCQSGGERTKLNSYGVAAVSERTGSWPNETDLNDKTVFNTPGIRLWEEVKQSHHTPWRRRGERTYSSYSFMASVLDGVSVQFSVTPRPRFTLTKRPLIPIGQKAGWAPEPV
jgi:hypothetical protein